jgi:ATP-dependent protease Clp ATPase subunit
MNNKNVCNCSFCGVGNTATEVMIAGNNNIFICAECISVCSGVVAATISIHKARTAEYDVFGPLILEK